MVSLTSASPPQQPGPAWEIARLFPDQGKWDEWDYLYLNRLTNRQVEFSDGHVEVPPMPTKSHQRIVSYLLRAIEDFSKSQNLGQAVQAPYPLKLRTGRFREPDIVFALSEHARWLGEAFAEGADLVVEVLSEDRNRDLVVKRREYAEAAIPEYWIVDPVNQNIMVLRLTGNDYVAHGEHGAGQRLRSALLPGLEIETDSVFANTPA